LYTRLAEVISEPAKSDDVHHNGYTLLGASIKLSICRADSAAASEAASEAISEAASEAAPKVLPVCCRRDRLPAHNNPSIEGAEGIASMHTPSRSS